MSSFQAEQYLQLLGVPFRGKANLAFLQELQMAHLHKIPFENLNIHAGISIVLERDSLFQKIVLGRRGGFCYELNGLFHSLLTQLGYNAYLVSARVYESPKKYSPIFDHMAILVRLKDALYLSDVGFGDFSTHPILIEKGACTKDGKRTYVVDKYYEYFRVSLKKTSGTTPEYIFKPRPYPWNAFQSRSLFHQTNPQSHFQKGPVITRLTEKGRITLTHQKLIRHGQTELIEGPAPFEKLLEAHFGIRWSDLSKQMPNR